MQWPDVQKIIRQIAENADRAIERGLMDDSVDGRINALMALGGKRILAELKRRVEAEIDYRKNAAVLIEEKANKAKKISAQRALLPDLPGKEVAS